MSYELHLRLPDEARSLPPTPLLNLGSVWMGVHRQLLYTTVGFYVGHYMARRAAYFYAKRDLDIAEYIRTHPEDFKDKKKRKMAEVLEDFHPIR
ncbi:PREDICTED: NADH dehydrogenase [ubiquinone] 1 subunit C2-like [Gekko japonicus]|uniref:NADH dehydrogenase [ubiquinone] 1 subunit C2-like n=1 Tax=Gekko japonicus TaxID=146911 RepID=A0ABM1KEI7_GEKJA|nr:PREDICTED: NADH dehydrogenase [ubiquinone] 1 subunit C2-like [Gekko japonicus]